MSNAVSIRKNIFANVTGSAWTAIMSLAFVPFYIKLMGPEAYGVVGIFGSLQGLFSILDLGLSVALNRELARLRVEDKNAEKMASTVKTLETIYWLAAILIGVTVVALSSLMAEHWLRPEQMSQSSIRNAFYVMALVLGLRWPVALYTGGLNGLQKQVLVNILLISTATVQNIGAVFILKFVAPTVQAFFGWQAVVALAQVLASRISLKACVGGFSPGKFSVDVLRDIWRFAAGMSGITLLGAALTQVDKVILSKTLPLKDFGYYTFAATVAAGIYKIVAPVFTAYYPKMVELVAIKAKAELISTYHQGCQLMSILLLPAAIVLTLYSKEVLTLWTNDPDLVARTYFLFTLLLAGNTLNGLMNLPGALQMAYGWTTLAFYANLIAVVVLLPGMYFAVLHSGAAGAATVWIILNLGYLFITIGIMHRKILTHEMLRFYIQDLSIPFFSALAVAVICRVLTPISMNRIETFAVIAIVSGLTLMSSVLSVRYVSRSQSVS